MLPPTEEAQVWAGLGWERDEEFSLDRISLGKDSGQESEAPALWHMAGTQYTYSEVYILKENTAAH